MIADLVVLRVVEHRFPTSVARQCNVHNLGNTRLGSVTHKHNSIGQQYCFVDVVRDHEDGLIGGFNNAEQRFVLYRPARQAHQARRTVRPEAASSAESQKRERYPRVASFHPTAQMASCRRHA